MNEGMLSDAFINRMRELIGEEELQAYLKSFDEAPHHGLRINPLKVSSEEFLAMSGMSLEPISWIPGGFYYDGGERPARTPYYYAGLFYLQEPSAMTPAELLPVEPGDRVLDLCAAPGGKSTALGAKLKGRGILAANDISSSRAKALLKNLELWGIPNICVTSEEPETLAAAWGAWFHKILVDAPCSGEGMFRKDKDMLKSYEERGPEYYCGLQKKIMEQAIRLLRPGGLVLYSTCTFSCCENEDVIRWVLDHFEEMELLKLPPFPGAAGGIGLEGCLRLFPHKIKGEGHFIALLRKKGEGTGTASIAAPIAALHSIPPELKDFLSHIKRSFHPSRIWIRGNLAYYLPEAIRLPEKLRYLRTGLLLGELKKNRFEPGQALAMALKAEEFDRPLFLNQGDGRVIRYLKGETVELTKEEGEGLGWRLICVDGHPLGFGKSTGMALKNKYQPGWRWQS